MKTKKWLLYVLIGLAAGVLIVAGLNLAIDPFGVFGDRILNWYGYDMTNSPGVAKFSYLDKNYGNYDGYILGASGAGALDPLALDKYYGGAKFYNLMTDGATCAQMEQELYYVIDNYRPKHIVLALGLGEIAAGGGADTSIRGELSAKATGGSQLSYFTKFLFLDPSYSFGKLNGLIVNNIQPRPTGADVFAPELGVYSVPAAGENIVNIPDYEAYENASNGASFGTAPVSVPHADIQASLDAVRRMKDYCGSRGVSFDIISMPAYAGEVSAFDGDAVREYWAGLARIQSFWNFSGYSIVSGDPRFFYDWEHFRNITGDMALGKVYNDPDVYYPNDFGVYFTAENAGPMSDKLLTPPDTVPAQPETVRVPILMYHHLVADSEQDDWVTVHESVFRGQMEALKEAGYTAVFYQDLENYAEGKADLPAKPILITFDDGYLSNYEIAYPILEELGMKATISVIGYTLGRDKDPATGAPITPPRLTWAQAREMEDSGLIDIESHSYGLHSDGTDGGRKGALRMDGESTAAYALALEKDCAVMSAMMRNYLGRAPEVFTYPYGYADALSDFILDQIGFRVTAITGDKVNTVVKGDLNSVRGLYRINVNDMWPGRELINEIDKLDKESDYPSTE
ncbi:MAG: polysaccharide deacetylase family protein [Defluviitaleaceae bacterium]|nr:polysaccharide deacetylase family protein [Defluviitaleaceae bacterium]